MIKRGDADAVLAGGTESCIIPLILAGFTAMRGLAAEEEHPPHASRPFDATRAGFVMGGGPRAAAARGLGARPSVAAPRSTPRCSATAPSNDAHHMAQPEPEATGVAAMMRGALERAGVEPDRVGYINAHGTSTPLGDAAETKAIKDVFGDHAYELAVSSTKSMMGHTFGAAGAIEAIMCVLALRDGVLPPTINYREPDPGVRPRLRAERGAPTQVDVALSNAMGLGGHNGCVLLGRVAAGRRLHWPAASASIDASTTSASRERIVARREVRVRDREHAHPGRLRRADAVVRVLDRGAAGGVDAEPARASR